MKFMINSCPLSRLIVAMLVLVLSALPELALANEQSAVSEAGGMKFIALQKNYTSAARKSVAQKPPLRFFTSNTPKALQKKKPSTDDTAGIDAAPSQGSMTNKQAKLMLSIFEEGR